MVVSRAFLAGLIPAVILASAPSAALAAPSAVRGPHVRVKGGELVTGTGRVLWARTPQMRRPMGSITKVMTALIVLDAGHLQRRIRVSRAAVRYVRRDGASSAGLIAGDVLTVRQLLEAMLLPSGCDAAYLLATAYGPGRVAFIRKMNDMARAAGMTSTHFSSFDGMPFPTEHSTYSTPADLIKLGELALRYPVFRRIVRQPRFRIRATWRHHRYLWWNTNGLIGSYRGAIGIKTGDTRAAGNCLLFAARRHKHTLLGVVLYARPSSDPVSAISAARVVLTWGFHRPATWRARR